MAQKTVCIEDFCGRGPKGERPYQFWADWNGKVVGFGGVWEDVPDMPAETEPSEEIVRQWVFDHYGTLYPELHIDDRGDPYITYPNKNK